MDAADTLARLEEVAVVAVGDHFRHVGATTLFTS